MKKMYAITTFVFYALQLSASNPPKKVAFTTQQQTDAPHKAQLEKEKEVLSAKMVLQTEAAQKAAQEKKKGSQQPTARQIAEGEELIRLLTELVYSLQSPPKKPYPGCSVKDFEPAGI